MDATVTINFKVTPSQKESIDFRVLENGFDDISAYLKVVALKTKGFHYTSAVPSAEQASIELGFKVTPAQKTAMEEKAKESGCEDLSAYLRYVALHGAITAIIEVRSTGNLDSMLERIAASRRQ